MYIVCSNNIPYVYHDLEMAIEHARIEGSTVWRHENGETTQVANVKPMPVTAQPEGNGWDTIDTSHD